MNGFEHTGYIQIFDGDKEIGGELFTVHTEKALIHIAKNFECETYVDKGVTRIAVFLKKDDVKRKFVYQYKNVSPCGFDSTNNFLRNNLNCGLDSYDKEWYTKHRLTTAMGLPQEYTLTVTNDLVKPYNIGVSRVWMRKHSTLSDDQKAWISVLGCNPLGTIDRDFNNEEYAIEISTIDDKVDEKLLEMSKVQASKFNFEFTDVLPRGPYIIYNSNVGMGEIKGGHAEYAGPRAPLDRFMMALKLDFIKNINYLSEPPTFGEEPFDETTEIDLWECLNKDGEKCGSPWQHVGTTEKKYPINLDGHNVNQHDNGDAEKYLEEWQALYAEGAGL